MLDISFQVVKAQTQLLCLSSYWPTKCSQLFTSQNKKLAYIMRYTNTLA